MNLEDKVVLVTGSSGGLGAQICYGVAKQGAAVVSYARGVVPIEGVRDECKRLSGKEAYALEIDVSNPEGVGKSYGKVMKEVGRINILMNSANFGTFEDFPTFGLGKAYDMFEVNILGIVVLTWRFAIDMAERRRGRIINIASMAGKMTTAESTVYSVTKFAVLGFSSTLRLELRPPGVAVMTVNPGPTETNFFDKADPSGSYLEKVGQIALELAKLAKMIVRSMRHPKRKINQPFILEVALKSHTLFPTADDYSASGIFNKK